MFRSCRYGIHRWTPRGCVQRVYQPFYPPRLHCLIRIVPIVNHSPPGLLFNHLVSAGEERSGHSEAKGAGGREIENQIKLSRLLDRNIPRACPAQNFIAELSSASEKAGEVRAIGHHTSCSYELSDGIHGWKSLPGCPAIDLCPICERQGV